MDKNHLGIVLDNEKNRQNHFENLLSIGIPLLGTCIALALIPWVQPSKEIMGLFFAGLLCTTLGTTIGLHRFFTHRSYKTSVPIRIILSLFATLAMQGTIIRWVADHRRHHRFTDKPGDLHSPYYDSNGVAIVSRLKGLWHAHTGWMFTGKLSDENRYAPDLTKDPVAVWFSRNYWALNVLFLLLCGGVSYLFTQNEVQSVLGICYAGCLRVTLIHQFTWAVNSIGHTFGSRIEGSTDKSTNNYFLAFLTIGDGLHSSHHVNPARGVNPPVHFDIAGMLLIFLEKLGLIWRLRR